MPHIPGAIDGDLFPEAILTICWNDLGADRQLISGEVEAACNHHTLEGNQFTAA